MVGKNLMKNVCTNTRLKIRDKGAAALEFALVLPLLLILSMAIIEFGRAYNVVVSLQGASREGARALALGNLEPDLLAVDAAVRNATVIDIDTIEKTPCTTAGGQAEVVLKESFNFGIPLLPRWSVTLSGDAAMRCGL
jgi:Flp pilus assembly protein TadG